VIATTRSTDKRELLTGLGADVVIVTGDEDLTQAVLAATGDTGVDVVLDHVAGDTFAQCLPATAVDGHVVNIGRLAGPESTIDIDALSYRHLTVHGVSFGFSRDWETVPILEGLRAQVLPAIGRGEIRPIIDSTFDVTDFPQAAQRLRSGKTLGKIVLGFV
jgi:NADPH:quinone reductase-like Zn-dependent oxidoreductase